MDAIEEIGTAFGVMILVILVFACSALIDTGIAGLASLASGINASFGELFGVGILLAAAQSSVPSRSA